MTDPELVPGSPRARSAGPLVTGPQRSPWGWPAGAGGVCEPASSTRGGPSREPPPPGSTVSLENPEMAKGDLGRKWPRTGELVSLTGLRGCCLHGK